MAHATDFRQARVQISWSDLVPTRCSLGQVSRQRRHLRLFSTSSFTSANAFYVTARILRERRDTCCTLSDTRRPIRHGLNGCGGSSLPYAIASRLSLIL